MYDRTGAGSQLRKYTICSLAWWHSYKWATKQIIKVFASDFIAPWFHHLWPEREFSHTKASHPANSTYLSYIRLAYPTFRGELERVMALDGHNLRQKTLLTNLNDLCQFFIPVVHLHMLHMCVFVRCWLDICVV